MVECGMNKTPVQPLSFELAWPIEAEQRYQEAEALFDIDMAGGRRQLDEVQGQEALAVGQHILNLARTQGLAMPPCAEHVQANWLYYWKKAANQEPMEQSEVIQLGQPVAYALRYSVAMDKRPAEEKHAKLINLMETGDFPQFITTTVHCHASGQDLRVDFKGWTPTLMKFDRTTRKHVSLEDGDIVPSTTWHAPLSFPSGRILVADWFRHDTFTKACAPVRDANQLSGDQECAKLTREMARELNILHVEVGNTTTSLAVLDGGILGYGEHDEDDMTLKETGSVCNDLWWTTMVDEEILRKILSREHDEGSVDKIIESFLNEGACRLDVPPGTYHLYYSGRTTTFKNTYDQEFVADDDFKRVRQPYFSLRKEARVARETHDADTGARRKAKP